MEIRSLAARTVLDSRGQPTLEVELRLADGSIGRAMVPSGASTGRHEAHALRDGGKAWGGQGVTKALANIHGEIAAALMGMRADEQKALDDALIALDKTAQRTYLGANAMLGVSLAAARAAAASLGLPLWRYLGGMRAQLLPVPQMNILNGGAHADNALDVQECMIVPLSAGSMLEALRMGSEIFHALKAQLKKAGHHTGLGDEGGFAPALGDVRQSLDFLLAAIAAAGLKAGRDAKSDIALALDAAAGEFYRKGNYHLHGEKKTLGTDAMVRWYEGLCRDWPLVSLEDGMAESDVAGWQALTEALGQRVQLVGDDIFVTQTPRLARGIARRCGNAILVKPNQCGTLSETLAAIEMAQAAGWRTVISHRSGDTEDPFIADLAVATHSGQIKTGSLARSERLAKYNQLLRIEEALGAAARYAGRRAFACLA